MPKNCPRIKSSSNGTTLIEVLIAIVLLGLVTLPILVIIARLNHNFTKLTRLSQAASLTQTNLEILLNITQKNWGRIAPAYDFEDPSVDNYAVYPLTGTYHLERVSGVWQVLSGPLTAGPYTTQLTFKPVCRDINNFEIQPCTNANTELDPKSITVISQTDWEYQSQPDTYTLETIFTNIYSEELP